MKRRERNENYDAFKRKKREFQCFSLFSVIVPYQPYQDSEFSSPLLAFSRSVSTISPYREVNRKGKKSKMKSNKEFFSLARYTISIVSVISRLRELLSFLEIITKALTLKITKLNGFQTQPKCVSGRLMK